MIWKIIKTVFWIVVISALIAVAGSMFYGAANFIESSPIVGGILSLGLIVWWIKSTKED